MITPLSVQASGVLSGKARQTVLDQLKLKIDIKVTQMEALSILISQRRVLYHKGSDVACSHSSCDLVIYCPLLAAVYYCLWELG